MKIEQFVIEGLGHQSYAILDTQSDEMAVVDPRRDVESISKLHSAHRLALRTFWKHISTTTISLALANWRRAQAPPLSPALSIRSTTTINPSTKVSDSTLVH